MYSVISLNIIVVLCAYLAKFKEFKFGLKLSFLLIFIFLAIRFDFGNDYMNYYKDFIAIGSYSSINYFDKTLYYEPGWLLLIKIFKPFGFFTLVTFLSFINCLIFYLFIKKYVPVQYFWLAVFIYVFNSEFMLIHASAMRQSIAINLFILAIPYIYKKDFLPYLFFIILGSFFHFSAIVLIPVYFLGFLNWRLNNLWGSIIFLIFISLFIFGNTISPVLFGLIGDFFQDYEGYIGTTAEIGSGIGVLFLSGLLIFIIYYSRFQPKEINILFNIAIIGFMFIPIGLLVAMISRVSMYFTPATIVVYPILISKIKKPVLRNIVTFFLIAFTLYTFYTFFNSEVFGRDYENYRTIFSVNPSIGN